MTRYLCPDCIDNETGQQYPLEDGLECSLCGGRYMWVKKVEGEEK